MITAVVITSCIMRVSCRIRVRERVRVRVRILITIGNIFSLMLLGALSVVVKWF